MVNPQKPHTHKSHRGHKSHKASLENKNTKNEETSPKKIALFDQIPLLVQAESQGQFSGSISGMCWINPVYFVAESPMYTVANPIIKPPRNH
jgi:hypothetical protein